MCSEGLPHLLLFPEYPQFPFQFTNLLSPGHEHMFCILCNLTALISVFRIRFSHVFSDCYPCPISPAIASLFLYWASLWLYQKWYPLGDLRGDAPPVPRRVQRQRDCLVEYVSLVMPDSPVPIWPTFVFVGNVSSLTFLCVIDESTVLSVVLK